MKRIHIRHTRPAPGRLIVGAVNEAATRATHVSKLNWLQLFCFCIRNGADREHWPGHLAGKGHDLAEGSAHSRFPRNSVRRAAGRRFEIPGMDGIFRFLGVEFLIFVFVQDPRGAPEWSGVRLAQKEGDCSIQKHFFKNQYDGSEDCLYLNVYAPPVSNTFLSFLCL
jgi:Carboxylesterase family